MDVDRFCELHREILGSWANRATRVSELSEKDRRIFDEGLKLGVVVSLDRIEPMRTAYAFRTEAGIELFPSVSAVCCDDDRSISIVDSFQRSLAECLISLTKRSDYSPSVRQLDLDYGSFQSWTEARFFTRNDMECVLQSRSVDLASVRHVRDNICLDDALGSVEWSQEVLEDAYLLGLSALVCPGGKGSLASAVQSVYRSGLVPAGLTADFPERSPLVGLALEPIPERDAVVKFLLDGHYQDYVTVLS